MQGKSSWTPKYGELVPQRDVTTLLSLASGGDEQALSEVWEALMPELRRVAARHMASERPGHTLQATEVVNEAYLRLVGSRFDTFDSRSDFLRIAGRVMRNILVDYARKRLAAKRGGGMKLVMRDVPYPALSEELYIARLHDGLHELEREHERSFEGACLRAFVGLSWEEIATTQGVDVRTVRRDRLFARAFLDKYFGDGR